MSSKVSSRRDPLLSAVLARLPARGAGFPAAEREAWLTLLRHALDVAYGAASPQRSAAAAPVNAGAYKSHVDAEGFARGPDGKQIMAAEIPQGEPLWDLRGFDVGNIETVAFRNGYDPRAGELAITMMVPPK